MKSELPDGLYGVDYKDICAAFEVENGEVTRIAPVLVKRFVFWERIAKREGDAPHRR